MKWKFYVFLAATLASFAITTTFAADSPRAQHVFIISFDQGNPDLIQTNDLPTFNGLASEAAHTWSAYTIIPSITLPAHTSMLSGLGPQAHQVLWNGYAPEKGVVTVPTIFSLAKQRGRVTAMFVGKEKFKHLNVPGSLDVFLWPQPEDNAMAVAKAFAAQVGKLKPNLCFLHFRDPDTSGHKYGAYAPEKIEALKHCDTALKIIKDAIAAAGLIENSVIILTADHGSHDIKNAEGKTVGTHGSAEPADVRIPWVVWGKGVKKQFSVTAPVTTYDTAATALWLLGIPLPENFWGRPVISAFE
jgi:predicted AlkP superfamily pyrophosphatase or phosphodiesterase